MWDGVGWDGVGRGGTGWDGVGRGGVGWGRVIITATINFISEGSS